MYDPELYRERAEVDAWRAHDPIVTLASALRARGAIDDAALAAIEQAVAEEIAAAIAFAEAGSLEPLRDLTRFVYAEQGPA
jgi:TPP-dependent pyruvate/acetoin dehydrogenase alpha subunit